MKIDNHEANSLENVYVEAINMHKQTCSKFIETMPDQLLEKYSCS